MEDTTTLPMLIGKSSSASPRPWGVFRILREAFTLLAANGKVVALLVLLVMIPFNILLEAKRFALLPLAKNLHSHLALYRKSDTHFRASIRREILDDSRSVLGVELVACLIFLALAFFSVVTFAVASAMSYPKEKFSLWKLLLKVKDSWMRPQITFRKISLLLVAHAALTLLLLGIIRSTTEGRVLTVLSMTVFIFAIFYFLYLAAVWTLALVVSVEEEDCYGLKAVGRAEDLIKGRKLQGFLLMSLLFIAGLTITLIFGFQTVRLRKFSIRQSAARSVELLFIVLLKLFTFMVYTVFYHECKKIEDGKLKGQMGMVYTSAPYADF